MHKIEKAIIKVKFINNDKFMELDKDEKELFYDKYKLVYNHLPVIDLLSIKTRKIINNGLMDSIINKNSSYINYYYVSYFNKILDTPTGKMSRQVLYNDFFNKNESDNLLSRLYQFIEFFYLRSNLGDLKEINNDFFLKAILIVRERVAYKELANKELKDFYEKVLLYIVTYFVSHDNLFGNEKYFLDICNFFEDNLDYLYVYYTSNYVDKYRFIPEDLINKYNNGLVKKMIL